jgi:hypothetical protein
MQLNFKSGKYAVTPYPCHSSMSGVLGVSLPLFPRGMPFTKWGVAHGMTGHPTRCGDLVLLPDLILDLH